LATLPGAVKRPTLAENMINVVARELKQLDFPIAWSIIAGTKLASPKRRLAMSVRELARVLAMSAAAALLLLSPARSAAKETGWRDAVDRLAQEKTLAESCVSILKTFADSDPMARVQGQRLYARAKADVDGLIRLLIVDLAHDRSPAAVPELRQRLEAVPTQRQALCRQVDAAVGAELRKQGERTRNLWVALLTQGIGDAIGSTIEAGVEIWKEYRRADEVRRQTIASQIEGTRWRDYAEVPRA
jgi:hypothetical protein